MDPLPMLCECVCSCFCVRTSLNEKKPSRYQMRRLCALKNKSDIYEPSSNLHNLLNSKDLAHLNITECVDVAQLLRFKCKWANTIQEILLSSRGICIFNAPLVAIAIALYSCMPFTLYIKLSFRVYFPRIDMIFIYTINNIMSKCKNVSHNVLPTNISEAGKFYSLHSASHSYFKQKCVGTRSRTIKYCLYLHFMLYPQLSQIQIP